jgi:hypothetical protein
MTAAEAAEWGKTLSFEKVWAAIMETDKKMAEAAARSESSRLETDKKMTEAAAQFQAYREESAAQLREMRRVVRELSRNIGGVNRSLGKWAEQMVAPKLRKKFVPFGLEFVRCTPNLPFWENDRVIAESDMFLENGGNAMSMEIKSELTVNDVDEHLDRIKTIRRFMDSRGDRRKLFGAVAGAIIPDSVSKYAQKQGLYVLGPSGKSVAVLNEPDDFKPREW